MSKYPLLTMGVISIQSGVGVFLSIKKNRREAIENKQQKVESLLRFPLAIAFLPLSSKANKI